MTPRTFSSIAPVFAAVLAVTLSACSGSGFSGGSKKITPSTTDKPAKQSADAAQKPQNVQPAQPVAPVAPPTQPVQPNNAVDAAVLPPSPQPVVPPPAPQAVVPNIAPVAPVTPVSPAIVPPPSKPDESVSAGQLKVAATCYVNMEQGYHGTDENYIVQLKDGTGVVAAGYATIDAVRNGQPTDGEGAYPGVQLNFDLTYVRPGAQSGTGNLSVCYSDPNVAPEKGSCQEKSGQFGGEGDRPSAIKNESAQWTVSQDASGKPEIKLNGNYNLSTHHPVWAYAAPGKCFKDFQSPIVMDMNGNGRMDLVDVWNDATQIHFDLMGEGKKTRTGWVSPQDGFLALDFSGNGTIDSGLELFGEYTQGSKKMAAGEKSFPNGFAALALYDLNQDGVIDAKDAVFNQLVVWQDLNQDGISQKNEIKSLKDTGITSLSLAYEKTGNLAAQIVANNEVRLKAEFTIRNAKTGKTETRQMSDVWFKQRRYTDGQVARAVPKGVTADHRPK